jgi:hypothetical protein
VEQQQRLNSSLLFCVMSGLAINQGSEQVMSSAGGMADCIVGEGWAVVGSMGVLGWEDWADNISSKAWQFARKRICAKAWAILQQSVNSVL